MKKSEQIYTRRRGSFYRVIQAFSHPLIFGPCGPPDRPAVRGGGPEVARLGRTLRQWRTEFLGYFDTGGASNGGTEAMNGLIELHRRVARGFRNRDNYRLRMLLIGGGLNL